MSREYDLACFWPPLRFLVMLVMILFDVVWRSLTSKKRRSEKLLRELNYRNAHPEIGAAWAARLEARVARSLAKYGH